MSKKNIFFIHIFFKKRKKYQIIRPLLELHRTEILKLCCFWSVPAYVDISNQSNNFRRNRLRYQLFPLLRVFFNKKIDYVLARHIKIINAENYYFINLINKLEQFYQIKNQKIKTRSNYNWDQYLPISIKYRFYRYLLKRTYNHINFYEIKYLSKK